MQATSLRAHREAFVSAEEFGGRFDRQFHANSPICSGTPVAVALGDGTLRAECAPLARLPHAAEDERARAVGPAVHLTTHAGTAGSV
jgi:hypothetical protein